MSNAKLQALKDAFGKKNTNNDSGDQTWKLKYPFWKMPVDSVAVVRFLPDLNENNHLQFLVENLTHELVVNGERHTFACNKVHGEHCPVCELSAKYYDEEGDGSKNGKKYYRKKSYIGQVIVMESPIDHDQSKLVKLIEFGPQVYKQLQAAFSSGDLEEAPYEFKGGYNFRFRKTLTGNGDNSYTTSNFAPKQTDLEDDLIEKIELYDLAQYRAPKLSVEAMEALLVAEQTGGSVQSTPSPKSEAPAQSTPKAEAPAPKAETPAQSAEGSSNESKTMSVMERLRAKAAQAS